MSDKIAITIPVLPTNEVDPIGSTPITNNQTAENAANNITITQEVKETGTENAGNPQKEASV